MSNTHAAFQERVAALAANFVQHEWPAADAPAVMKSVDTVLPPDAGIKQIFNLACARLIWLQFSKDKPEVARLKVVRESLSVIIAFIQSSGLALEDVMDLIVQVEESGLAAAVTADDTTTLDLLNDEIQRVSKLPLTGATKQALLKAHRDAFDMEMEAVLTAVASRLAEKEEQRSPKMRAEAAMQARYPGLKPAAL